MWKRLIALVVFVSLTWAIWWLFLRSTERQILAAQETFLAALEDREWETVGSMMKSDFAGPGGLTADAAMQELQRALEGFVTLDIEARDPSVKAARDIGVSTQIIRITGLGSPLAIMVRDKANQLQTPWLLHWRKTGDWPWEWQLTQAFNEGL
ncbi:MAG: hypothetical protein ACKO8Z_10090 [Prosthecobacter sp.]